MPRSPKASPALTQSYSKCIGTPCPGAPSADWPSKFVFFLITVQALLIHSAQHMQNKLGEHVNSRIPQGTSGAVPPQLWYSPAGLISSPPKPLQNRNSLQTATHHRQPEYILSIVRQKAPPNHFRMKAEHKIPAVLYLINSASF